LKDQEDIPVINKFYLEQVINTLLDCCQNNLIDSQILDFGCKFLNKDCMEQVNFSLLEDSYHILHISGFDKYANSLAFV
jgi:hypothetical protein